jgi:hypothetical protein
MGSIDGNIVNDVMTIRQMIAPNRREPLLGLHHYRMCLENRTVGRRPLFHFEKKMLSKIDFVEL